jgi:putative ABC transport system substrate-binding protein
MTGDDPVAVGLVESFNRPGGNATGVSQLAIAMEAKRLEILRELIPKISVIAMLINPNNPQSSVQSKEISDAARVIGVQLHILNASTEQDFETVFPMLIRQQTEALIVGADPFFTSRSEHLAALSARYMVPAIYPFREFIASGGLMSYGASLRDVYRWVGIYAGRVLNGARPAELPVLQPTKFELVINLKTAKALGLDVPATVLSRADEVIE